MGTPVSIRDRQPEGAEDMKDPFYPDCILVTKSKKLKPFFRAPKGTYYRFNQKTKRMMCAVTVMPDGTHVAWDTCGGCSLHIKQCTCKGLIAPKSIDHIMAKTESNWDPHAKSKFNSYDALSNRWVEGSNKGSGTIRRGYKSLYDGDDTPQPVRKPAAPVRRKAPTIALPKKPPPRKRPVVNLSNATNDNIARKTSEDLLKKVFKSL